jgi:hypothetical protein
MGKQAASHAVNACQYSRRPATGVARSAPASCRNQYPEQQGLYTLRTGSTLEATQREDVLPAEGAIGSLRISPAVSTLKSDCGSLALEALSLVSFDFA